MYNQDTGRLLIFSYQVTNFHVFIVHLSQAK